MQAQLSRAWKFVILFLANLVIIVTLLYGFEYYLKSNDPFLELPFDTGYYYRYKIYYPRLEVPQDGTYTWGHRVVNNRFGFRERDFKVPKPAGVCRIMILGDSLTWGAGLAVEERYTYLAETYFNEAFPDRQFEVLSFAPTGAPTVTERDILRDYKDIVSPDLIVTSFVLNDPQPKGQDYSVEREEFNKKYGYLLDSVSRGLVSVRLPQTAKITREATEKFIVKAGVIPPWEVAMQRTYEEDSQEWAEFKQALQDIKTMSDKLNLPPPFFVILNQGIYADHPTDYRDQSENLHIFLKWYHQAEQAAAEAGFRTYNHEKEFIEQLDPAEIPVTPLDGHPSARVNLNYAQKLFETIVYDIRSGELCAPTSLQESPSLTDLPLSTRRLMSVRLGDNIRFLGYVADQNKVKQEQTLHLTFGWQIMENIDTSYTIFIHLLDEDGQQWAVEDTLPCGGNCPTNNWPQRVLITPPNFSIIHQSSSGVREWMQVKEPLASYSDDHKVFIASQIPPGEYSLVMGMYDVTTRERLSAYDEITETWLPEAQIVLGKITIP